MIRLLFLLVTVAAVLGSYIPGYNVISSPKETDPKSKPCQTEAQWEGRASEWNHITENNNRYKISFDGVGLRKRVLKERKSFMPGERRYEYIMEFKTNTLYTINLNYNTCTVTNLTQPWQNHTIPTDATLEDEYELGAPGSGFKVREWSDRIPARRVESWIGIFTVEGCWPVVEVVTDGGTKTPVSLTTRFFDLKTGIANMTVFDPPDICMSNYEYESEIIDGTAETGAEESSGYVARAWDYVTSFFN